MNNSTTSLFDLALSNLLKNQTSYGFAAARPQNLEKGTYASLFPRDIGVITLGALASGKDELTALAKTSLDRLSECQSERGQFPQNYEPETGVVHWWMPGTIDGTLWWSIALLEYVKQTDDHEFLKKHEANLEKAFTWLTYQDTNNDSLLEQGEAAGWDDEMPRQGTVLYTNALWYWLVGLIGDIGLSRVIKGDHGVEGLRDRIYEGVNTLLWVHKEDDRSINYVPDNDYTKRMVYAGKMIEWSNTHAVYVPYYLGYSGHRTFEMRCETFGNILACLVGLADKKKQHLITDFILRAGVNQPYPVKVLYPPIYPGEPDWREYMAKGRQNYPWQYHNGGIWPFIGGFWVWWLSRYDKKIAQKELEKLAAANAVNNNEFNEYLHGQHGTPMGVPYQSWNMAMYIKAYKEVTS